MAKLKANNSYKEEANVLLKLIILHMHDKTVFSANDEEWSFWRMERNTVISKKSMGSGIMMSDFVNQQIGYLSLTNK